MPDLSILIPSTRSRHAWWPWLHDQLVRQAGLKDLAVELVVAGPPELAAYLDTSGVAERVVHLDMPDEDFVAVKRNALIDAAEGTFCAWFDDDDWHRPDRLATSLTRLAASGGDGFVFCGLTYLMVEGAPKSAEHFGSLTAPVFTDQPINLNFVWRRGTEPGRFDERKRAGADTEWLARFCQRRRVEQVLAKPTATVALFHGRNTSQWLGSTRLPLRLASLVPHLSTLYPGSWDAETWALLRTVLEDARA